MDPIRAHNLGRLLAGLWRMIWPIARQAFGWLFIVLGLLGLVLPLLQGVLFLVIGIALVGRRNVVIRRARVAIRRLLRRWAAVQTPVIGPAGRAALRGQREFSRRARHLHYRYEAWTRRRFGRRATSLEHPPDRCYEHEPKRV